MSDVTGTPGSRTRFTYAVSGVLSARELGALRRFVERKTVVGDVSLVEVSVQKIIESAKKTVARSQLEA